MGWSTCSLDDSAGSPQAIKNDITNLEISTPRAVQDVTGIDKSAFERILLLADCSGTLNGVFNTASNMGHAVLKTVSSTSVNRTLTLTVASQTLAKGLRVNRRHVGAQRRPSVGHDIVEKGVRNVGERAHASSTLRRAMPM